MSRRVVYTPSAARDLEAVLEYISKDDPAAAARMAGAFQEAIGLLADYPLMGRSFEDSAFGGHRALVVGNYLIFYVVSGEDIQIRRVLHGARRYEPLLKSPGP